MKLFYLLVIFFALITNGCDLRERELAVAVKEDSIHQKEQQLLLLEKQLKLKEEALLLQEQKTDTALHKPASDSARINLSLVGKWAVQMRCIETTCEGSAVGDTKNETWAIEYQNDAVLAKAMSDNKIVRIYTGTLTESGLQLVAEQEPTAPTTKIMVRVQQKSPTELEGVREINRPEGCHIIYAMTLRKI